MPYRYDLTEIKDYRTLCYDWASYEEAEADGGVDSWGQVDEFDVILTDKPFFRLNRETKVLIQKTKDFGVPRINAGSQAGVLWTRWKVARKFFDIRQPPPHPLRMVKYVGFHSNGLALARRHLIREWLERLQRAGMGISSNHFYDAFREAETKWLSADFHAYYERERLAERGA